MRRIVLIAAGMAGITTATRLKRGLPESEIVLVLPASLEKLQSLCSPDAPNAGAAARRLARALPDLVRLPTREVGIVEAKDIMPDLQEKELSVTSSRGSVNIRYSNLIIEVPATVRLPRSLQQTANVLAWPMPGFSAEPEQYDIALAKARTDRTPVVVVGSGIAALDAVLLACESGATVHWLRTDEGETPDMDPFLLQLALNALADTVNCTFLPGTTPDRLDCRMSVDGNTLKSIVLPDGSQLDTPCVFWTSPLMGRHPILREEGVSLDAYGRLQTEEPATDAGLYIIGSGSAVPSAPLPGTDSHAPLYPGAEDCADVSATLCLADILEDKDGPARRAGTFGLGCAYMPGLGLWRSGYSLAEASKKDLEAEYAVVSASSSSGGKLGDSDFILSLVGSAKSRTLVGVQVLFMDKTGNEASRIAAEGLFGMAHAALVRGDSLADIRAASQVGLPGKMLATGASILLHKMESDINGISPDELVASRNAGAEFFTLDLRSLNDWQAGHLPGAHNIPLLQLKKRLQDEVPHFTPLVLVSEDGTDAYAVACKLRALGAASLYVLDGGMRLWPHNLETA